MVEPVGIGMDPVPVVGVVGAGVGLVGVPEGVEMVEVSFGRIRRSLVGVVELGPLGS